MQTGYYIDGSNYIQGPQYGGQFYINHDNYICGPRNNGIYYVDNSGKICGPGGSTTGFYILNTYIWGPSMQLPWLA